MDPCKFFKKKKKKKKGKLRVAKTSSDLPTHPYLIVLVRKLVGIMDVGSF